MINFWHCLVGHWWSFQYTSFNPERMYTKVCNLKRQNGKKDYTVNLH